MRWMVKRGRWRDVAVGFCPIEPLNGSQEVLPVMPQALVLSWVSGVHPACCLPILDWAAAVVLLEAWSTGGSSLILSPRSFSVGLGWVYLGFWRDSRHTCCLQR